MKTEDRRQGDRGWEIGRETEDRWMGDMKTEKQGDRRCVEGTQGGPTSSEMQKNFCRITFNKESFVKVPDPVSGINFLLSCQ